jgi:magnesium transporter
VLHRLPWLAIGLVGAMVSARLVGASEEDLAATIQLAFFLPAIVYMADAVGTQTEVIVVRALSLGVPIRRFARREMLAGLVVGAIVAAAFAPFGWLIVGESSVVATVCLALFVSSATAGIVALLLPWLLSRAGFDPAFGSGPLSTVIQDLLSIAVYLALAHAIVG